MGYIFKPLPDGGRVGIVTIPPDTLFLSPHLSRFWLYCAVLYQLHHLTSSSIFNKEIIKVNYQKNNLSCNLSSNP